jgi:hypothetical protein
MMKMCMSNMSCEGLEKTICISFGYLLWKTKSIVNLSYVYYGSSYGWSKKNSSNYLCFLMSKRFQCAYFIKYVCKLSNVSKNKEI